MSGSSAERLARLRWLLTGLFTALNAAGLLLFAWLVLQEDRQQGQQALDGELRRVSTGVQRLLKYDEQDRLITASVGMDELNARCPQFAIVPVGNEAFQPQESRARCVELDDAVVMGLAADAVRADADRSGYVRAADGRLVRVYAEGFRNPYTEYVGGVVTWINAQAEQDRHEQRVLQVAFGCLVIIGVLGVVGHVISGRAMRPAVAALEQQEVLLSDIAHDLRKPVTSLRALAETALRHPAQRDELLPRAARLAARMGGIIEGLLLRARFAAGVQELAAEPAWLDQLVSAVVEDMATEDGRITLTASPTRVVVDPVLIQRAVANLVGNALQHGHRPGAEPVVHVTVAHGRVVVADEGPGIDAARAEPAFERFAGSGASSGLGLAIVRWIAHAHGGVLRVYNAERGGAMFELTLPVSGT